MVKGSKVEPAAPAEEEEGDNSFDEAIAVLAKMKTAKTIDAKLLTELNDVLGTLSPDAQRAFLDLPVVQSITERASDDAAGKGEPGSVKRVGGNLAFAFKVPYSLNDLYEKWPPSDEPFIPDKDETVITPGGWVFRLKEGMIYDIPQGEECPEDHAYKLPCIVVGILRDAKTTLRANKRETEKSAFGMGVRHLEVGWAGKAEVQASEPKGHNPADDQ
jgi:hypothetical protein